MVKNKALSDSARLCCTSRLVTLSLFLSPMPFILRVPLDPAEAGPQQYFIQIAWDFS